MSGEDDKDWGSTGYSKFELEDFINELSSIYVSNFPPRLRNRKRRAYLVDGLIANASINIFYGDPKVGKSLLLVDIVTSLANGRSWANLKTEDCLTIYLAFEDPEGIEDRLTLSTIKKRDFPHFV